jgi:hypothetical protein
MKTNIFQIHYDQATKAQIDPGFLPLENPGNLRADWREYWPIRRFFLENTLNENELYGFLSPSFYNKSRLSSAQVYAFIDANPGRDVYSFSPLKQDSMCYLNVFEHGNRYHPGMIEVTDAFMRSIGVEVDYTDLVMDLRTTIFCNYFAAKPVFWEKWFAITERMFEITESESGELSDKIGAVTDYRQKRHSPVDMKVFIVERIASLVLALDPALSVAHYDIEQMPWSEATYYPYRDEMMTANALKMAYAQTANKSYLRNFFALRNQIFEKCDPAYPAERKNHFF